jgi:hypothetical protein
LPGSKSLNKVIPLTTQNNRGIVRHGDFYPGRVAVIKGSAFVNSKAVEMSARVVRDSDRSQRFFREIRQTDVV